MNHRVSEDDPGGEYSNSPLIVVVIVIVDNNVVVVVVVEGAGPAVSRSWISLHLVLDDDLLWLQW